MIVSCDIGVTTDHWWPVPALQVRPLSGSLSSSSLSSSPCHYLSLIRHKVMSKLVIFKIGPWLSTTQFETNTNKTLAPWYGVQWIVFRNLSVHGLSLVLCHWNWLPGVLIQQRHPRVGWNIIMNAGLQPGAQHLSVTGAYLMKYNSIIHTSLQLNKSPLNTSLS